jgi:hypothetical protein
MTAERPVIADDLDVNETDDGLVIYQPSTDRVHHLNNTASVVLELCDGVRSVADIANSVGELFELDVPPLAETEDCLVRLLREGLVH